MDDGAYLATLIVIETVKLKKEGKGLSTLLKDLAEPTESVEIRLPFDTELLSKEGIDFGDLGDKVITELKEAVKTRSLGQEISLEEPNFEGVRINFDAEDIKGWALLRKSLHDPIMPLNIEAEVKDGIKKILVILREFLSNYHGLDISKL